MTSLDELTLICGEISLSSNIPSSAISPVNSPFPIFSMSLINFLSSGLKMEKTTT